MTGELINWYCQNCGAENVDVIGAVSRPECGNCEEDFDWDEILEGFRETTDDAKAGEE
jgi:hypothetical protein